MPFAIGTASVHRDPPHDHGDHDTPLWSGRDGDRYALIWPSGKAKYFLFWGLTRFPKIGSDNSRYLCGDGKKLMDDVPIDKR
jgi:hypothetical protein